MKDRNENGAAVAQLLEALNELPGPEKEWYARHFRDELRARGDAATDAQDFKDLAKSLFNEQLCEVLDDLARLEAKECLRWLNVFIEEVAEDASVISAEGTEQIGKNPALLAMYARKSLSTLARVLSEVEPEEQELFAEDFKELLRPETTWEDLFKDEAFVKGVNNADAGLRELNEKGLLKNSRVHSLKRKP